MTKIIQKPLACRNAHCGAMCSVIMAEDCMRIFREPRKCPHYERDDIGYEHEVINKIRAEIEQLPTRTRTNWDGCCPDIDYPEIEYVDVTKKQLLDIIDKYKGEIGEERYEGKLYFDYKNGVYGVNTSSDRNGKFFPFPYKLKNGNVDWKKFKKHWKDVYEFVGETLKKDKEESEEEKWQD